MKKLRWLAVAGVSSMTALAALMAACGDDDTVVTNDAGEGGTEGGPDAPPDPGTDGGTDALPDAPPVPQFVAEIEAAFCSALSRCCFGNANIADGGAVDGGTFNGGKCRDLVKNLGFEFSSVGAELLGDGGTDAGTVSIDPAKAVACKQQLQALTCSLTGAELATVRAVCFEAFAGAQNAGQPCRASIECAKGNYCNPDAGSCTALAGDGGSCNVFQGGTDEADSVKDEEACSWRGSGDTKLRCDSYDENTGLYRPRVDWVCRPQVGIDAGCNSTVWCDNGICNVFEGYYCQSPVDYFAGVCFRVVDPP